MIKKCEREEKQMFHLIGRFIGWVINSIVGDFKYVFLRDRSNGIQNWRYFRFVVWVCLIFDAFIGPMIVSILS